ncbi:hypothetical protein OGAPHI_002823 [Ogataea philodendri]|uniref:Uncharacterized protein n=1 Tax=Ogataea philodendri TaxID=1378263 RepID=A0A9P8T6A3_9ASCO|nr:uncharacterized protein OGAPHI_002823 [Ogataea philodendri]KAH3667174.1 hypothetical protein OGAPHI_002823 [Ogataea philodendri]
MTYDRSKEMEQQAWVAERLNRTPALSALNGLLSSFPVVKIFTSNAVPLLIWREHNQAARLDKKLNH